MSRLKSPLPQTSPRSSSHYPSFSWDHGCLCISASPARLNLSFFLLLVYGFIVPSYIANDRLDIVVPRIYSALMFSLHHHVSNLLLGEAPKIN